MGSYATDSVTPAIVIFVNKANPISKADVPAAGRNLWRAAHGRTRRWNLVDRQRRVRQDDIRTWDSSADGQWRKADPHPRLRLVANALPPHFRKGDAGGDTWNPALEEFPLNQPGLARRGPTRRAGGRSRKASAADRYAIGLANIQYARDNPVRPWP